MRALLWCLLLVASACCASAGVAPGWSASLAASTRRLLAAGRHRPGWHTAAFRRLLAQPATARQCAWDAESRTCDVDDAVNVMYAIRAQPASPYLWFLMATYDREDACGRHASANACAADKTHRCLWLDDILDAASKAGGGSSSSSSSSGGKPAAPAAAGKPAAFTAGGRDQHALLAQLAGALAQQQLGLKHLLQQDLAAARTGGALEPAFFTDAASAAPAPAGGGAAKAQPRSAGASSNSSSNSSSSSSSSGKAEVLCTSADMLENYVFSRSGYSNPLQAPLSLHCPGSRSHELAQCMRVLNMASCRAAPGCGVVPRNGSSSEMCVSKYFKSLNPTQMTRFMADLVLAEPSVVGSCDGACWMRQALLCNRTTSSDDCAAMSFCRVAPSGACTPRLYAQDNFGSSVQEYMGECADIDNRRDCEGMRLQLVRKGAYGAWAMPASPASRCPVPSIGGVLGSQKGSPRAAQERAAQLASPAAEYVTVAGAVEEQAATLDAAAAAASDAARVARLMSVRGVTGLQQLYASVASVFAD